jgi:exodeoxyribonuclease VII large subunit
MTRNRQISLFEESAAARPAAQASVPPDSESPIPEPPPLAEPDVPDTSDIAQEPAIPDGSSRERAISIADLNAAARGIIEGSFTRLWVVGEISNWRASATGHRYFTLRDENAELRSVMFQGDARRLPAEPEDGMEVLAYGQVTLYERRGSFEFIVRALEGKGRDGLWRIAFEKLKQKLGDEGLLDPARKRRLPTIPARVAVVTSLTGAALRDVMTVVRRRAPWTHLLLCDCRVQGEGAAEQIGSALRAVSRREDVDVIILTRGGGSVEDLWSFNEEVVARAIAACPVPVVSAVGHEVDITIADLVADVRAPTPSAAAELVVPDRDEIGSRIRRLKDRLIDSLRRRTDRGVDTSRRLEEQLLRAMDARLERWAERMARQADRLDALSPLGTLRRGYAVPLGVEGEVLRRLAMFRTGGTFRLRVVDGVVHCTAEETEDLEAELEE